MSRGVLLALTAIAAVAAAGDDWRATRQASQGFRTGDALYFVLDYLESRPGRTFWFILPFQTGPHVRLHQVALCRSVGGGAPEVLAVLEQDRSSVLSRNHMFRDDGERILIAYSRLWDTERKVYVPEVFAWTPAQSRLERTPRGEAEPVFARFFADCKSPYTANPGIVERSVLKELLPLAPLPAAAPR